MTQREVCIACEQEKPVAERIADGPLCVGCYEEMAGLTAPLLGEDEGDEEEEDFATGMDQVVEMELSGNWDGDAIAGFGND